MLISVTAVTSFLRKTKKKCALRYMEWPILYNKIRFINSTYLDSKECCIELIH